MQRTGGLKATRPTRLGVFAAIGAALIALTVGGIGVLGASAGLEIPRICHRTSASNNPYRSILPNTQGQLEGHFGHTGDVWVPGAEPKWGDIIPPIPELNFPGLNWNEQGMAIHANDCVPPNLPPPTNPPPTNPPGPPTPPGPESPAPVPVPTQATFTG